MPNFMQIGSKLWQQRTDRQTHRHFWFYMYIRLKQRTLNNPSAEQSQNAECIYITSESDRDTRH